MIILSLHPIAQMTAIILAFYAAYLGFNRTKSLHFGIKANFNQDRHIVVGTLSLIALMSGMAGGAIMVARYLEKPLLESMHGKGGMTLLPFLLFGLFSGFYMYLNPDKRKILPALHAINNLIILCLAVFQLITGILFYLKVIPPN
ncbi:MAG: DUF4079 family protein [Thermodesulfobacteriota bacterium]